MVWDDFSTKINYLIPRTLTEKMILFLRAVAPENLTDEEFKDYHFTRDEI